MGKTFSLHCMRFVMDDNSNDDDEFVLHSDTRTHKTQRLLVLLSSLALEKKPLLPYAIHLCLYTSTTHNTETLKTCNPNSHVRIVTEFPFVIQRWNRVCCVWIGKHCVCIKVSISRHTVVLSYTFTATDPICIQVW